MAKSNRLFGNISRIRSNRVCPLILSLSFLILGMSCSAQRATRLKNRSYREWKAYQWQIEGQKDENGQRWTSYSRKVEGSKFKEFKIVGEMSITPALAVKALRARTEDSTTYLDEDEGFIEVLSNSKEEALVYSVYNMPFPFKDRAMCERFVFSHDKESGTHKISWKEDWEHAPKRNDNAIKMPVARGSWEFIPINENLTKATYIVHADPGGSIPAWLVNLSVANGLYKEL